VTPEKVKPGTFGSILTSSGERVPAVAIDFDRAEDYSLEPLYEQARREREVTLSPHGALRDLGFGNYGAAIDYLARFGPLRRPEESESDFGPGSARDMYLTAGPSNTEWLNLKAFFAAHRRFASVAQLYEAFKGDAPHTSLVSAWRVLIDRLGEINQFGTPLLDDLKLDAWGAPHDTTDLKRWITTAHLRQRTPIFIAEEITQQAGGAGLYWSWIDKRGFVMEFEAASLWSIVWRLFARDSLGLSWRVCPHCNRIFYPRRKDSRFCTPKLQANHAKREWDRKTRTELKRNRSL
jgi:hypothetical protein